MPDIVLAILVFAPLAITFLLKSNAALAFLALCAGFVLISFASADIGNLTKNLSIQVNSSTLNLLLLIVPFALTLLLTPKAFSGRIRLVLQCVCALCAGGLLALVAIPLLSESVRLNFANSWGWNNLQKLQTPLISGGIALSLVLVWFGKSASHHKKHK
jgi:hypothetical protein